MRKLKRVIAIGVLSFGGGLISSSTSSADPECAISATGDPVEICISNTISGGGGSSGGGSLIYTLRPMSALVI